MRKQFDVTWLDLGREPKERPNPRYPHGIDLDISKGAIGTCKVVLQYPAPRCGTYLIRCKHCGTTASCTTAGRRDDPRSVRLACAPGQRDGAGRLRGVS